MATLRIVLRLRLTERGDNTIILLFLPKTLKIHFNFRSAHRTFILPRHGLRASAYSDRDGAVPGIRGATIFASLEAASERRQHADSETANRTCWAQTHVKRSAYSRVGRWRRAIWALVGFKSLDVRQPQWLPDPAHTDLAMQPARH